MQRFTLFISVSSNAITLPGDYYQAFMITANVFGVVYLGQKQTYKLKQSLTSSPTSLALLFKYKKGVGFHSDRS